MIQEPKFKLRQPVYFMENNKVKKSTIIGINYPKVWITKNGRGGIEQTATTYMIKSMRIVNPRYGNSNGMPECWLFATKKELLKTL